MRMPDPSLKLFLLLLPNLGRIPQTYQNMLKAFETATEYLSQSFTITIPGSLRRTIVVSNQTEGVMVHQGTEVCLSYTIVTNDVDDRREKQNVNAPTTNQVALSCRTDDQQWFFCLWHSPTRDKQCAIQVLPSLS